ncbi:MAG: hypothetical protein GXX96_32755 [Planctomycetaceae bacterium]|nr:hypothetical protein [Planctomycetaceae bacterium]
MPTDLEPSDEEQIFTVTFTWDSKGLYDDVKAEQKIAVRVPPKAPPQ